MKSRRRRDFGRLLTERPTRPVTLGNRSSSVGALWYSPAQAGAPSVSSPPLGIESKKTVRNSDCLRVTRRALVGATVLARRKLNNTHRMTDSGDLAISVRASCHALTYQCSRWANVGYRNEDHRFTVLNCTVVEHVDRSNQEIAPVPGSSSKAHRPVATFYTAIAAGIWIFLHVILTDSAPEMHIKHTMASARARRTKRAESPRGDNVDCKRTPGEPVSRAETPDQRVALRDSSP
ncbi:hypothetical protein Q5P01_000093 [Channa striata]|uniref:Uncharacterized protein n=1 Tax=Channa striata TaxID=64152 RepID=A0AA88IGR3_CHASR|nr:hypothetical protein Q5P01_000093 [Channa striata]